MKPRYLQCTLVNSNDKLVLDFLLQLELENFYFYQWKMSISVFKLFYSHNMRVKESDMGFRVCEWSSGENQFSPVTSLRFLNYRWWPIPHFSGIYFVCICEHICMTGYNELFLGKSIKIAINFYTKVTSRNCVVIDYSSYSWLLNSQLYN